MQSISSSNKPSVYLIVYSSWVPVLCYSNNNTCKPYPCLVPPPTPSIPQHSSFPSPPILHFYAPSPIHFKQANNVFANKKPGDKQKPLLFIKDKKYTD